MIVNIFLVVLFALINAILLLLPTGSALPAAFQSGLTTVWAWMKAMEFVLPLDALAVCVPIAFGWVLFVFTWEFIHWVLRKLPFTHLS